MNIIKMKITSFLALFYLSIFSTPTQELVVGSTLDLSKTLKVESESTREGLHKAFDKINREGGINGKRIKLVIFDDEGDSEKARKNIETLIEKHATEFIISPMGAVAVLGFIDMIKDKKIVVVFPSTGDPTLRDPKITYMIHFRPSYTDIDIALLHYAQDTLKAKKFAFFYSTDESATGIEDDIKTSKISKENYILTTYPPASTNFKAQVEAIIKFNPDTIGLFGTSRAGVELIRQLGINNLVKKWVLGVELGDELFRTFLKEQGLTKQFVDTQNLPNPQTSTLEIVQEYRKEMGTKQLDIFSLEAYISASVFAEIIKLTKETITKENFIKSAENIKNLQFKGLELNFDPDTRQLSRQIWLDTGEKEWISITIQTPKTSKTLSTTENGKKDSSQDIPPAFLGIKR